MSELDNHKVVESHDERVTGYMSKAHCHDCWKYTDDVNREQALVREAAHIVVNATPSLEQMESFKAADEFLTAVFRKRAGELRLPTFR